MSTKTYDAKCYELARHFLQDDPNLSDERYMDALAAHIQEEVERFIDFPDAALFPQRGK